jgi:hypothetical protein
MRAMARFLVALSEDPFEREEYQRRPERVLRKAQLSEEERLVLRKRDAEVIRWHFGDTPERPVPRSQSVIPPPEEPKDEPAPEPPPQPKAEKP